MEFTNFIFAVLIAVLFSFVITSVMTDAKSNYTQINGTAINMTSLNDSYTKINTAINASSIQAQNFQTNDNAFGAAFGYLFGAFSATVTLVIAIPSAMQNVATVISQSLGIALFPNLLGLVYAAIMAIAVIGILYYLLKVR